MDDGYIEIGCSIFMKGVMLPGHGNVLDRVVTSDVFRENHVRRTSSGHVRTNVQVDRPPADGTSERPVGRPSGRHLVDGHRTTCRPPLHPADGHPIASRPLRLSVAWRTAAPSAGRGGGRPAGRTAWRTPPLGPSARGRPPSRNFGGP
jgi:hypothetical protein